MVIIVNIPFLFINDMYGSAFKNLAGYYKINQFLTFKKKINKKNRKYCVKLFLLHSFQYELEAVQLETGEHL